MKSVWFVRVGDKTAGPFPASKLKEAVRAGRLTPEMLVRKGTEGKWFNAGDVNGLFPIAAAAETEAPPPSQSLTTPPPVQSVPPVAVPRPVPPRVRATLNCQTPDHASLDNHHDAEQCERNSPQIPQRDRISHLIGGLRNRSKLLVWSVATAALICVSLLSAHYLLTNRSAETSQTPLPADNRVEFPQNSEAAGDSQAQQRVEEALRAAQLEVGKRQQAETRAAETEETLRKQFGVADGTMRQIREITKASTVSSRLSHTWEHGTAAPSWITGNVGLVITSTLPSKNLQFSPDESLVAYGGHDGVVKVWHVENGRTIASFEQNKNTFVRKIGFTRKRTKIGNFVSSIAFTPDGKALLFPNTVQKTDDDVTTVIDLMSLADKRRTRRISVKDGAYGPTMIVSTANELRCQYGHCNLSMGRSLRDAHSPDLSMALNMIAQEPVCCAFSRNGDVMVYGSLELSGGAWQAKISASNADERSPRWTVYGAHDLGIPIQGFGDTQHILCLAISPDDTTAAVTVEESFAVHLIDLSSGKVKNLSLSLTDGYVLPSADNQYAGVVDLSHDGKLIAVTPVSDEIDNYVLVVDRSSGRIVGVVEHAEAVWQMKFSPSGDLLATVSSAPKGPTKINVWNLRDTENRGDSAVALIRFEYKAKRLSIVPPGASEREFNARLKDFAMNVVERGLDVKTVGQITCPKCNGAGRVKGSLDIVSHQCPQCNGKRVLIKSIDTRTGLEMLDPPP